MYSKHKFKNFSTLILASYAILISCDSALAQNAASFVQMRELPPVTADKHPETSKAARLITIKEKKPIPTATQLSRARIVSTKSLEPTIQSLPDMAPPVPKELVTPQRTSSQLSRARIVSTESLEPPIQSQSDMVLPAPEELSTPPVPLPQPAVIDDVSRTNTDSSVGYYTVSFANPDEGPQPDEDSSAVDSEFEPDSPVLDQLEADDEAMDDTDEDLESSEVDDLDLADDDSADESSDELDYDDEDDTPIVKSEFGQWPSKPIQAVHLDLAEYGDEAPEDRSSKLFESSQRFDGSVPATEKVFAWAAPNIKYQQLYFEDVALERYGQTEGLVKQPFVSAGRFLADRLFLTTRAFRDCPGSCDSPLGFCRPGSPSTIADGSGCGCACQPLPQEECQACQ